MFQACHEGEFASSCTLNSSLPSPQAPMNEGARGTCMMDPSHPTDHQSDDTVTSHSENPNHNQTHGLQYTVTDQLLGPHNTGSSVEDSKVIAGSSTTGCTESPSDFGGFLSNSTYKNYDIETSSSSSSNSSSLENINLVDSYISGPDDSATRTPNSKSDRHLPAPLTPAPHTATVPLETDIRRKYNSFKSLAKKSTCHWNDFNAHIIYSALSIKRYYVEADYILCPDVSHDQRKLKVSELLQKGSVGVNRITWSDIEPMIQRILAIFDDDTRMITDKDFYDIDKVSDAVNENIASLPLYTGTFAESFRAMERGFHASLHRLLEQIESNVRKGKPTLETVYELFFEKLLHFFFSIVGNWDARISQTFNCQEYILEIPSLGRPEKPQPDYFIKTYLETLLAVVEVKSPYRQLRRFANYKGSGVHSCKHSKAEDLDGQDDATDAADAMETENEVLGMEGEMLKEDKDNDEYEIIEGFAEAKRSADLPQYTRNLEIEEKKQLRCFLPQLLGQILACFPVQEQCISQFKQSRVPLRLGIGMVGLKVRFVSVVLKDEAVTRPCPVARDLDRASVKAHVYVTKELNLFHGRHLGIFFKTLFALCSLD